jgi:hypothetical protein
MDCVRGYSTAVPYTCPSSSTSSSFFFHHRRARRCRRTYFPQHQHVGYFMCFLFLTRLTPMLLYSQEQHYHLHSQVHTLSQNHRNPPPTQQYQGEKLTTPSEKIPTKNTGKKHLKTQKKRVGVVWHTMVSNHSPGSFLFNGAIKSGDAGSLRTDLIAGLRVRDGDGGFVAGRGRRAALAAAAAT